MSKGKHAAKHRKVGVNDLFASIYNAGYKIAHFWYGANAQGWKPLKNLLCKMLCNRKR